MSDFSSQKVYCYLFETRPHSCLFWRKSLFKISVFRKFFNLETIKLSPLFLFLSFILLQKEEETFLKVHKHSSRTNSLVKLSQMWRKATEHLYWLPISHTVYFFQLSNYAKVKSFLNNGNFCNEYPTHIGNIHIWCILMNKHHGNWFKINPFFYTTAHNIWLISAYFFKISDGSLVIF